jgi:hypothetical protein
MAPFDYGTCNPVIGSYHTINTQSTCTVSYHITIVQPSQLPRHLLYNPVTLPHQLPYSPVTLPRHLLYNPYVVHTFTCQLATATSCIDCHVSKPYWCQPSPKTQNLSDTCHLLVMPHQHDDIIMTSPIILLTSIV